MVPSLAGLVAVLTTSQTRAQENCGESIIADICIMIDRTGWPAKSG